MNDSIFTGCIPALMTPCKADRTPDFDALVRKGKELIEAGMSAVVYCGSMGDWPLLTDEQRMQGVEALVEAVRSPNVRTYCEIGFNGGHSAMLWLVAAIFALAFCLAIAPAGRQLVSAKLQAVIE